MSARKDLGIDGENLAAKYLESLGYSILERNFRHRLGEIDILAEYEGHLVICEVKSRSSGKIHPFRLLWRSAPNSENFTKYLLPGTQIS